MLSNIENPPRNFFCIQQQRGEPKKYIEGTTAVVTLTYENGKEVLTKSFDGKEKFLEFFDKYVLSYPESTNLSAPSISIGEPSEEVSSRSIQKIASDSFDWLYTTISTSSAFGTLESNHPLVELLKPDEDAISALTDVGLQALMSMQIVKINEIPTKGKNWVDFSAEVKTLNVSFKIKPNRDRNPLETNRVDINKVQDQYAGTKRQSDGLSAISTHGFDEFSTGTRQYGLFDNIRKTQDIVRSYFAQFGQTNDVVA